MKPLKQKKKQNKVPLGRSHIDYLPDDIIIKIYKSKHQLEFTETLNIIKRFNTAFDSLIPIKKLLSKATDRKQIYINVMPFYIPDTYSEQTKIIQHEFNTNTLSFHKGRMPLCQLEIKFNKKCNILIVDILYIVEKLGLTKRSNRTLVDITTNDIHLKTAMIAFQLI